MKVLIIDDDIQKLNTIIRTIKEVEDNCSIDNAVYGKEALRLMKNKRYDLLIVDLNLPFTEIDEPTEDGGKKVVNEIYRNIKKIYVPNYIVGLTSFKEIINDYFNVWKVFHYESNNTKWVGNLKKILSHISHVNYLQEDEEPKKPTIFVEGETDFKYLNKAIDLFYPEFNDKVSFKFTKGNGGTNWVVNQSLIWMNSYNKDSNMKNIKAVALLDKDIAGKNAAKSIKEFFQNEKQRSILKIYTLDENNCEYVKNFFAIGCHIQFEIESMFNINEMKHAEKMGWLEENISSLVRIPKDFKMLNYNLKEYLLLNGIKEEEILYLKKVSWASKEKFCNFILNYDTSKQREIFKNFKNILQEIFKKLELI